MVDDGIDGNGSLSSLSVANDELSLSSSDWDETIDGLETGLHGFVDGLSWDDTWGLDFDSGSPGSLDWSEAVDGVTEGIEYSTQHFFSDWDIDDGTGSADSITLLDLSGLENIRYLSLPKMTTPTLSVSKLRAIPLTPDLN